MEEQNVSQIKMVCQKHGDVPFLIVEAGDYQKMYCLVCVDEVFKRLGVHAVHPIKVEAAPVVWPESLEVE